MARKSMNLVDVEAWLSKAAETISGKHVANLYFDKGEGLLFVKLRGGSTLLAEPGRRIHFTVRRQPPAEYKPHPLVILSRKYLRERRLVEVSLVGGDRVVSLSADNGFKLIVELVPRGVAVLVSEDATILAASRYVKLRDRVIKPKAAYTPPPVHGRPLSEITPGTISEAVAGRGRLVPALVTSIGLPGEVVEEAVYRAGLDPAASRLSLEDGERLLAALRSIIEEARGGKGYIVVGKGGGIEADPFNPTRYGGEAEVIVYEDFNSALEDYFEKYAAQPGEESNAVGGERARLLSSLERARMQAEEYRREAALLRRVAEGVSRNYEVFARFLECLRTRGGACMEEYKVRGTLEEGRLIVAVGESRVEIPLTVRSVEELVVELYKRAGVLESKAERAEETGAEMEAKLRDLSVKAKSREIAALYKRRRRYWFESFHYTVTRNLYLAIGGRDAGQNELLVRRYLEPQDVFMHADIHGAPAVVVKSRGSQPGEGDLYDAAVITVAYSKGWRGGVGSVRVFYVPASQVSLSPPSGEYLARGGIMVYGRRSYLDPLPVRLWIGVGVDGEGVPRIIQGSREVVERHALAYAGIVPGDEKRVEAARTVKQGFIEALSGDDEKALVMAVPEEDLASRIPGKAAITGVWRGRGEVLDLRVLAG